MKTNALILMVAVAGFGAASAQTPSGRPPGQEAAVQAMHKACASDSASLCPGVSPHEALGCMRKFMDKLSPACRQSIIDLPPGPGQTQTPKPN